MQQIVRTFFLRRGQNIINTFNLAGGISMLFVQVVKELFRPPFYFKLLVQQIHKIGVESFVLAMVTGLATGAVMALQFGAGLQRFGGTLYVPKIVTLSILREMGPVFTSLLVAGRIGAGIASEVGSMKVTQQVDAIRALGTSPIQRIVIPRVLACLITLPMLTLLANVMGCISALLVCNFEFDIGYAFFINKTFETIRLHDLMTGLSKTVVFAFFISLISCWRGLTTEGGTQGVGNTTTWVVVTSSIFILISDFFLSKLFIEFVYRRGG